MVEGEKMSMKDDQQPQLNLLGRVGDLKYYRTIHTGKFEEKTRIQKGVERPYKKPILDRIYFSEEEVRNFSLDKHGLTLPYVHGHVVMMHEYIWDFWGYYFGSDALAVYGHLLRYAYGKKDWCFPSLKLISIKMGCSLNFVKDQVDILENYGFVYHFTVQDTTRNSKDTTTLYKVRKKVPFLSMDLIEGLPDKLKELHDEFMEDLLKQESSVPELLDKTSYEDVYGSLYEKGDLKKKNISPLGEHIAADLRQDKISKQATPEDHMMWGKVLSVLEKKIAKPSFDTWIRKSFAIRRGDYIHIYFETEFQASWVQNQFHEVIQGALHESEYGLCDIVYSNI